MNLLIYQSVAVKNRTHLPIVANPHILWYNYNKLTNTLIEVKQIKNTI